MIMGGRGWAGKSSNSSLTYEQLQTLGVGRGEGPGPTLVPPPLYPKTENPPLPLIMDASMDYMLILKKQFIDYLHDSPSYVQPVELKSDVERYSDKYKVLSIDGKNDKTQFYCGTHVPQELRMFQGKQISISKGIKRKLSERVDLTSRFEKPEKLEKKGENDRDDKPEETGDKSSSDEEGQESEKEEIEDPDEEMDDNTDYLNNYFDNGEGFDDEDDNLDEGPIY